MSADSSAVFVPLTMSQWRSLVASRTVPGPLTGFGATTSLLSWAELGADETEDGLYVAQQVASVAALLLPAQPHDRRIVVAVPADHFSETSTGTGFPGEGTVTEINLDDIHAVFADELGVCATDAAPVARARVALAGVSLIQAWDSEAIATVVEEHDLGWFTVTEAARWAATS